MAGEIINHTKVHEGILVRTSMRKAFTTEGTGEHRDCSSSNFDDEVAGLVCAESLARGDHCGGAVFSDYCWAVIDLLRDQSFSGVDFRFETLAEHYFLYLR